ncbi:MAG: zinc metalloprotease HtpX [Thermoplasmatota archaeon]|nr:zinc metalloprotease HtpX [Candidatus Thermoplasmatota archaeon]MBU1914554.1 zinc metalloprotease HtpX [Candidatus Thermoplasmatota archaeon]
MHSTLRMMALFMALTAIFVAIGYVLGAVFFGDWILGSLMFLVFAGLINFISYFFSDKIVLWSYRAKPASKAEQPRLYSIVNKVCLKADLPMPRIAIIPTQTPNAFATGRNKNNAVIAATEGLMSLLTDDELEGVLAHEMAHIKDRDILLMSVAATIAGAISFATRMALWSSLGSRRGNGNILILLLVAITAPLAALLLRLAISRSREYKADKEGALMIQRPLALARALEKLEEGNRRRPMTRGSPSSSSLFIVNPFTGGTFVTLFMTHPPIAKRVKRLEDLADKTGFIG